MQLVLDDVFPPFLDLRKHAHLLGFWDSVFYETELLVGGFENLNFGMKPERKSASDEEVRLSYSSDGAS